MINIMPSFKKQSVYTERSRSGFTLVELMVTIAIIALVVGIVVFVINPTRQLQKARDAQRKDDISAISQALGQYALAQNGDYPVSTQDYQITGASWNSSWQPYMIKVPQDPLPNQTYSYNSDGKSYQLYAKLEIPDANGCSPCGPGGDDNYGISSGNSKPVALSPAPSPTAIPSPTSPPTPTPTPKLYQGNIDVSVSSQNMPQMMKVTLAPFDPAVSSSQTISLFIRDTSGASITSCSLVVNSDAGSQTYPMTLASGSNTFGTWAATFAAPSHEHIYDIKLTATNSNNAVSEDEIPLELSLTNLRASQP